MYIPPYEEIQYSTSLEAQIKELTNTIDDQFLNIDKACVEIKKLNSNLEVAQLQIASSYSQIVTQLKKIEQDIKQNNDDLNDETIDYLRGLYEDIVKDFNAYRTWLLRLMRDLKLRHDGLLAKLDNAEDTLGKKNIYKKLSHVMQVYVDWAEQFPCDPMSLDFTFIFKDFINLWDGMYSGEYTYDIQHIKDLYQDRFVGERNKLAEKYKETEQQILSNSINKLNLPNACDKLIKTTKLYMKINQLIESKYKWPCNNGDLEKNYVAMQKFWQNVKNGKQSIQEWKRLSDDIERQKLADFLRGFFDEKIRYASAGKHADLLYKNMLEHLHGYCKYAKILPTYLQNEFVDKSVVITEQIKILRKLDKGDLYSLLNKLHQLSAECLKSYNKFQDMLYPPKSDGSIFGKIIIFFKNLFVKPQVIDNDLIMSFIDVLKRYINFAEKHRSDLPKIFQLPYDQEDYFQWFRNVHDYLNDVVKGNRQFALHHLEIYQTLHERNAQSNELHEILVNYHNQQVELSSLNCSDNDSKLIRYFMPFIVKPMIIYLFDKISSAQNYLYRGFLMTSTGAFELLTSVGLIFRAQYRLHNAQHNTSQQILFELSGKLQTDNNVDDQIQEFKKVCQENNKVIQIARRPAYQYGKLAVDMLELLFYCTAPMPASWVNKILMVVVVNKCREAGYDLSKYCAKTFFSNPEEDKVEIKSSGNTSKSLQKTYAHK